MRLKIWISCLFALALVGGIVTGRRICASLSCRNAIGILAGRGPLLALCQGSGIYERDLWRAAEELHARNESDDPSASARDEFGSTLRALIANQALIAVSRHEATNAASVNHKYQSMSGQVRPQRAWLLALIKNKLSPSSLRTLIAESLRAQNWIERRIADAIEVPDEECRQYYAAHLNAYLQPVRYRVRHLFLASPPETAPEIAEKKRAAMEDIWNRITRGENFSELVASTSEDEATKTRGGELGCFSESRMPADFFSSIEGMKMGEMKRIRTYLGFHIVQLIDSRPPLQRTLDQCRPEIRQMLANRKRGAVVADLRDGLSRQAAIVRSAGRPHNL